MKTFPHATPDGIIELVRKDERDAIVRELNERLTKQQSDMLDTIVNLRAELTTWPRRSSIPDPLAEVVKRMEAVPEMELERVWTNAHRTRLLPCINAVRARLIAAAKGEQL